MAVFGDGRGGHSGSSSQDFAGALKDAGKPARKAVAGAVSALSHCLRTSGSRLPQCVLPSARCHPPASSYQGAGAAALLRS